MVYKIIILIIFSFYFIACSSVPRFTSNNDHKGNERINEPKNESNGSSMRTNSLQTYYGTASYYAEKYNGIPTASGEIYNMNDLTAASNDLPFGTIVRVTNLDNMRSVVVRINDRGPFAKGRIIDLSKKAAEKLDMILTGTANVKIEVLKRGK